MQDFIQAHGLDIFTTLLGVLYIYLEYKAHIALWLIGIVMPALDIWLYWSHGLYGDAGMAGYYTLAALYGYVMWRWGHLFRRRKGTGQTTVPARPLRISHFPLRLVLPTLAAFAAIWAATYYVLVHYTNSSVPVTDAFTNALSFVALWALARKYAEQWMLWIVVDAVCAYLYIIKGIPFKAFLYSLYVVIAIMGYMKWLRMMQEEQKQEANC